MLPSPFAKRCLIKISGEAIRSSDSIFSEKFLQDLVHQIKTLTNQGVIPILIPGGGNICRGPQLANQFQTESSAVHRISLDYAGMLSTLINGIVLKMTCDQIGLPAQLFSMIDAPIAIAEQYTLSRAEKTLKEGKILIIAGGIGQPDFSSDVGVFIKAHELNVPLILMGKNKTNGVYSDDPKTNRNSKFLSKISFTDVLNQRLKIIDRAAAALGTTSKFKVRIFNLNKPEAILNAHAGKGIFSDVEN